MSINLSEKVQKKYIDSINTLYNTASTISGLNINNIDIRDATAVTECLTCMLRTCTANDIKSDIVMLKKIKTLAKKVDKTLQSISIGQNAVMDKARETAIINSNSLIFNIVNILEKLELSSIHDDAEDNNNNPDSEEDDESEKDDEEDGAGDAENDDDSEELPDPNALEKRDI